MWNVTVNDLQSFEKFTLDTEEQFANQNAAYPRDAAQALALARAVGLKSATLSGGRTPNPYGGDEVVVISVSGSPAHADFLSEMRGIIASGPDKGSDLAKHYAALARLREHPCPHIWGMPDDDGRRHCVPCGVVLNGTMFYYEDEI